MFGIIYLILCILTGLEAAGGLLLHRTTGNVNALWVKLPAAFGTGILLMTWPVYIISWIVSVCAGAETPLFYGNLAVMAAAAFILSVLYIRRKQKGKPLFRVMDDAVRINRTTKKEIIFFLILAVFITGMMFYVFHVKDGRLYSGFTVFGDYAPHTAMMRSFSRGNNFPTQYPHYGGADVKYHFMFQFLVGNLEYLGIRLDLGYNLVSILSLLGFLMILYSICYRIFHSFWAGCVSIILFVFRSGTAVWRFLWEHMQAGDLLSTLEENTSFIGYTANENWGLWNFNVYLNQRHLAFGLLVAALAVWIYMDWVEASGAQEEKGLEWLKDRFFTKEAWMFRDWKCGALTGIFMGMIAFWNGAALIGGLLILLGFAIFSDGKLDYALTALIAVILSGIQSSSFISGSAMSPAFYWGFLADNRSLPGVAWYLIQISGVFFLGLIVVAVFLKRTERIFLVGFVFPLFFAFLVSLTPDINVNHKYVMISYAFVTVFWGGVLRRLWKPGGNGIKTLAVRTACILFSIFMTATGLYDFVIIVRDNDTDHRMWVDMNSSLTDWLSANLKKDDLVLTPEYTMNDVTMSGVMMYCGWPYYAWSAGYDTYYRAGQAQVIYSTTDKELLESTVVREKITYILYEDGMEFEQQQCREDIIKEVYPLVYTSEDGRIRIYET